MPSLHSSAHLAGHTFHYGMFQGEPTNRAPQPFLTPVFGLDLDVVHMGALGEWYVLNEGISPLFLPKTSGSQNALTEGSTRKPILQT